MLTACMKSMKRLSDKSECVNVRSAVVGGQWLCLGCLKTTHFEVDHPNRGMLCCCAQRSLESNDTRVLWAMQHDCAQGAGASQHRNHIVLQIGSPLCHLLMIVRDLAQLLMPAADSEFQSDLLSVIDSMSDNDCNLDEEWVHKWGLSPCIFSPAGHLPSGEHAHRLHIPNDSCSSRNAIHQRLEQRSAGIDAWLYD